MYFIVPFTYYYLFLSQDFTLPIFENFAYLIERFRVTNTANGKREFVPPDQFFPYLTHFCSLPLPQN